MPDDPVTAASGYEKRSVTSLAYGVPVADASGNLDTAWIPHTHNYTEESCLTSFYAVPGRDDVIHQHGFLTKIVDAGAVSGGSPLAASGGLSKLIFVVNAGTDIDGTLTVTGTSVNRNTGAETGSATDDIVVDTLTTDDSDTDAEGNVRHAFTNAYITSKWFKGDVSISTADLDLSDVDVYSVAFEQFNDSPSVVINSLDITVTNVAAGAPAEWFYAYLYLVAVTGSKVDVSRIASPALASAPNGGGVPYRLRRGALNVAVDGTTDGIFMEMFFGPTVVNEWEDLNTKVWFTITDTTATTN